MLSDIDLHVSLGSNVKYMSDSSLVLTSFCLQLIANWCGQFVGTKNKHSHSLFLCLSIFCVQLWFVLVYCNRIQQENVKTATAAERERAEQDSNKQIAESKLTRKHVYLVFTHSS